VISFNEPLQTEPTVHTPWHTLRVWDCRTTDANGTTTERHHGFVHPSDCDALKYGDLCAVDEFDQFHMTGGWADGMEPGDYRARLKRELIPHGVTTSWEIDDGTISAASVATMSGIEAA